MFRVWISRLIAAQTIFYCRYIPPLFSSSLCSFHGLCFRRSKFSEIFVQSNILEYFLIDEERERERSNSYFFWKAISLKIRIFEIERNVWKDTRERAFNKSLRRKEGTVLLFIKRFKEYGVQRVNEATRQKLEGKSEFSSKKKKRKILPLLQLKLNRNWSTRWLPPQTFESNSCATNLQFPWTDSKDGKLVTRLLNSDSSIGKSK